MFVGADDRFLGTQVYWGRGNGWAAAALVSALEFGVVRVTVSIDFRPVQG